jgi:hypothetical protein
MVLRRTIGSVVLAAGFALTAAGISKAQAADGSGMGPMGRVTGYLLGGAAMLIAGTAAMAGKTAKASKKLQYGLAGERQVGEVAVASRSADRPRTKSVKGARTAKADVRPSRRSRQLGRRRRMFGSDG